MDRKIFRNKVMPLFTLTIILTFVSSLIGFQYINILSNIFVFIILAIASIVVLIIMLVWQRENLPLLLLFNLLEGFTVTPLMYLANITNPIIIPEAFGITSIVFLIFSFIGWITKRDLSSLGGILLVLLVIGLIFTFAQFFIKSLVFNLAVDIGVVLLFVAIIVYDMNKILRSYSNRDYIPATISLYLDFINIFVRIVSILIRLKRRR